MRTPPGQFSPQHALVALIGAAAIVYIASGVSDRVFGVPQERLSTPVAAASAPAPVQSEPVATPEPELQRRMRQRIAEEQEVRAQRAAAVRQAQAEEAAAQQEQEAARETAWKRYYKRPAKCSSPADDRAFVECGNHYLRARERFEQDYAAGKIK
ncbi:hypothetical protein [Niveibacterium sp. SC-1]|uniref:hypothetical protein n=1 Tax=Niveibacterium sp. SC-1 TaxID=3135646 RepID=UPI00311DAB49